MFAVTKQMIAADHDSNWSLHVAAVQASMAILRSFDAINYLRYVSWNLERIKVLELIHPDLYRRFQMGYIVVNDRDGAKFSSVAGDI